MREPNSCPDLGKARTAEMGNLPVDGSQEEFPDCPAGYLRTVADLHVLRMRFPQEPFAAHLVGGKVHPGIRVSEFAFEIESGARNIETVTPKMREGVHLWFQEKASREAHETKLRRAES